jgi:tetratricopeptide (TPR) repeat protein
MIRIMLLLQAVLIWATISMAQSTAVFTESEATFKRGLEHYGQGLFGKARDEFSQALRQTMPANEANARLIQGKARLYYARCAMHLQLPEAEKLMLDVIRDNQPDPIAMTAINDLASYYFATKEYEKAIEYFEQLDEAGLAKAEREVAIFQAGYAYFITKNFSKAKTKFREIRQVRNQYYEPTNYYLGMCYFFEGAYRDAIAALRVAENDRRYRDQIPYIICQIYMAERQYDELILYAKPFITDGRTAKSREIQQLLGQAYFEKGDYANALGYLENYAAGSSKMREEEFYQLGYAYYMTGNNKQAAKNFEQLSQTNSVLGQYAMHYLGDAQLKQQQKTAARTAFASARRMNFDQTIKEDANFNYAKLSYELKDPREALSALQAIAPGSRYYPQAQQLMGEIFTSTRDYRQAMEALEGITNKNPALREAYQKVSYLRGLTAYQQSEFAEARKYFNISLKDPLNMEYKALATYWLAELDHQDKQYKSSIRLINEFLTMARTLKNLPEDASVHTANYLLGYNYLKDNNHTAALNAFREAIEGIKRNKSLIKQERIKNNMLGDAIVRAADCNFRENKYDAAIKLYDEAITNKYAGQDYAMFQKATIEGLRNRPMDKIYTLERIVKEFPGSEFADNALFAIAETYNELGQQQKAMDQLSALIKNYKNKSDLINLAYLKLGLINYNVGNLELAISHYKQVMINNPTPEEAKTALDGLREIYVIEKGDPQAYFTYLETIPSYKVDNMQRDQLSYEAARAQFESGNYDRAIPLLRDYIARNPDGANIIVAYFQRAESYAATRQYKEALSDFEYVINRGPSNYFEKSCQKAALIAYNEQQDFRKSFDYYVKLEQATQTPQVILSAQIGAMQSAYRSQNEAAVLAYAAKVIKNTAATRAEAAQANYYSGKISFDKKDYNTALASFQEVMRLTDNVLMAESLYLTAQINYIKKDYEKALDICSSANTLSSNYPYWVAKCILLVGDIYMDKGEWDNARVSLEVILESYTVDNQVDKKDFEEVRSIAAEKLNVVKARQNSGSRIDNSRIQQSRLLMENEGN